MPVISVLLMRWEIRARAPRAQRVGDDDVVLESGDAVALLSRQLGRRAHDEGRQPISLGGQFTGEMQRQSCLADTALSI
ncbi:hypothetical protein NKJ16_29060 [Mesorhizobium sp. M0179]|uniref:hypothetical protein n=1 Tax=Mesorhizobium sp. M0179 TaxID=2956905 RepID=UPI003335FA80